MHFLCHRNLYIIKVNVDLDVLQILEIDDIKFTVSFSMYFGVRYLKLLIQFYERL